VSSGVASRHAASGRWSLAAHGRPSRQRDPGAASDFYGVEPITPDETGNARLQVRAPEDIPAYLAVMGTLEACARDWEKHITVLKLQA
jgi:hypothetical protein